MSVIPAQLALTLSEEPAQPDLFFRCASAIRRVVLTQWLGKELLQRKQNSFCNAGEFFQGG